MGARILFKDQAGNKSENSNRGGNSFPDFAWILPFVMIGAMFGSLAGAGLGIELGHQMPFGAAFLGSVLGMSAVALVGWLLCQTFKPG